MNVCAVYFAEEKLKKDRLLSANEHVILVKNVPAEVCTACGEKTYSPEITDELLKFAMNKPMKMIEIPLFDFRSRVSAAA